MVKGCVSVVLIHATFDHVYLEFWTAQYIVRKNIRFQAAMVDFIRERCKSSSEYSAEDILRARGILQTNGVGQGLDNSNAIYPTFSFISHRYQHFQHY